LIEGADADYLLADKGYDVQSIIDAARKLGMEVVIPPERILTPPRSFPSFRNHELRQFFPCPVRNCPIVKGFHAAPVRKIVRQRTPFAAVVHFFL
jgi:hypothetical protein